MNEKIDGYIFIYPDEVRKALEEGRAVSTDDEMLLFFSENKAGIDKLRKMINKLIKDGAFAIAELVVTPEEIARKISEVKEKNGIDKQLMTLTYFVLTAQKHGGIITFGGKVENRHRIYFYGIGTKNGVEGRDARILDIAVHQILPKVEGRE